MIVVCPNCNRKFHLPEDISGSFFRCICRSFLQIPGVEKAPTEQFGSGASLTRPTSGPFTNPELWQNMRFPNLTELIDLARFKFIEERAEEVAEIDIPSFDDLPSFDDQDDIIPGSEDIEAALAEEKPIELDDDLTESRQKSLDGVRLESEKLDPSIKTALGELEKSEDPQFIIDMLYYLLEVRSSLIKDTVQKFVGNPNPLADYFAKRILNDLAQTVDETGVKAVIIEPYPRESIMKLLFYGEAHSKQQILEKSVQERDNRAVPYLLLQLIRENNAQVKVSFLTKLGLLAGYEELPFFAEFLQESALSVKIACIEGLGCIGGLTAIPYFVQVLVDREPRIVAVTKEALRSSDKEEVSAAILQYLLDNPQVEKSGYVTILGDFAKNIQAFRALVWMFDYEDVNKKALDAAKLFDLEDDKKQEILEEYLLLSFDDGAFSNSVADYIEEIHPGYIRSKLEPVNVFDHSYVDLVRISPLFAREFQTQEDDEEKGVSEIEVEVTPFGLLVFLRQYFQNFSSQFKNLGSSAQIILKSYATELFVPMVGLFVVFLLFIKTMKGATGFNLVPAGFSFTDGIKALFSSGFLATFHGQLFFMLPSLATGAVLGSSLAISQARKGVFHLNFLFCFSLLISSVVLGYVTANLHIKLSLPAQFLIVGSSLLPFISIFYMVLLRVFSLVPQELSDTAILLGADEEQAITVAYGPFYIVGILYSLLLCFCYILGVQGFGFMDTGGFLSTLLYNHLYLSVGWQVNAIYGFVLFCFAWLGFLLAQFFVPIPSLFPSLSKLNDRLKYQNMADAMPLIGFLFYSNFFKMPQKKKSIKKIEPEAGLEEAGLEEAEVLAEQSAVETETASEA